jgi:hypothetical protein
MIHATSFSYLLQAEMEMVAGGLKKNLEVAERVHLLSLYRSVCTAGNVKTAAEALGLVSTCHDLGFTLQHKTSMLLCRSQKLHI